MQLQPLYIEDTPNKGRGVFAGAAIKAGTLIEICPVLVLPPSDRRYLKRTELFNYYFNWGEDEKHLAIALGYGSLYNHSFTPNAYYEGNFIENKLEIYTLRDIAAHEELQFNYNGDSDDVSPLWFDPEES